MAHLHCFVSVYQPIPEVNSQYLGYFIVFSFLCGIQRKNSKESKILACGFSSNAVLFY